MVKKFRCVFMPHSVLTSAVNGVFTRSSKRPENVFKIHMLMLDVCCIDIAVIGIARHQQIA